MKEPSTLCPYQAFPCPYQVLHIHTRHSLSIPNTPCLYQTLPAYTKHSLPMPGTPCPCQALPVHTRHSLPIPGATCLHQAILVHTRHSLPTPRGGSKEHTSGSPFHIGTPSSLYLYTQHFLLVFSNPNSYKQFLLISLAGTGSNRSQIMQTTLFSQSC